MLTSRARPIVLAILDGWGIAPAGPGNAISKAQTPNMDSYWKTYVHTQLIAHGESVGLSKREPGNTETGHLNIGAGSIVYQDLPRIHMSIADGSFFQNPAMTKCISHVQSHNSRLHLMGLVGGGGVHSDLSHLFALLRLCHERQLKNVFLHLFTDGRDSPPTASLTYIQQLESIMSREGVGVIASVMGRYYAMDRDFRWDRTEKAYHCLINGAGKTAPNIQTAVSQSYALGKTDEFIEPTAILNPDGTPTARIGAGDGVIFFNFRIDRPRQLTKAFVLDDFENTANTAGFDPYAIEYLKKHEASPVSGKQRPFTRGNKISDLFFVTMTEYEKNLPAQIAFPPQGVDNPLGRVISDHGLKQLRMSESEKERFVTYYFNGLHDDPFPNEDRVIIPSPKVPTYDLKPEMSAAETTSRLIQEIRSAKYDFIAINYANPDMVGHTGNIEAAVKAVAFTDQCIGQVATALLEVGGVLLITADHGNVEEMINLTTNEIDTEHNANPVPFIIIGKDFATGSQIPQGILGDIGPTVLALLNIAPPLTMNGKNLIYSLIA